MEEISTTYGDVRAGDVMFKGTVVKVTPAHRTRSGRLLMSVTYDNGETLYREPDTKCNLKRPSE